MIPLPSVILKIFRFQKFSETHKGSSTKYFGTVRQNFLDGKSWYHPFYAWKFFDTRNFLRYRRVPPRNILVLYDKNFSTENRDTSPLLGMSFLIPEQIFLLHRRVPVRIFFVLLDKTFSTENCDTPSFCIKYRNQLWNWCLYKPFDN